MTPAPLIVAGSGNQLNDGAAEGTMHRLGTRVRGDVIDWLPDATKPLS